MKSTWLPSGTSRPTNVTSAAAIHWSMPDPVADGSTDEATYPAFQRTAEELEMRIPQLLAQVFAPEGGISHVR